MELADRERQEEQEALRLLLNFQRNPTWKKIETALRDRLSGLELLVGDETVPLTRDTRAMLQGKLALCAELLFHLPRLVVERELADRSPSPEADDPRASLPDPARTPERF